MLYQCISFQIAGLYNLEVMAEQKFKAKKDGYFRNQGWIILERKQNQILRPRCTTRHHGDSLCQVSNNSNGNCRRSCAHKKLLTDRQIGRRTDDLGYNIIRPFGRIKTIASIYTDIPKTCPCVNRPVAIFHNCLELQWRNNIVLLPLVPAFTRYAMVKLTYPATSVAKRPHGGDNRMYDRLTDII